MDYPKLWERLGAAFIDWLIYTVFTFALLLVWSNFSFQNSGLMRVVGFLGGVLNVALIVGYKVIFESGRLQATPGKLVFGLQIVDAEGARPTAMRALLRTWPWWIYLVPAFTQLLLVGYWINVIVWLGLLAIAITMILPPGGRALHDITSGLFVMKTGPGLIGR